MDEQFDVGARNIYPPSVEILRSPFVDILKTSYAPPSVDIPNTKYTPSVDIPLIEVFLIIFLLGW